jgi:hypothetical protein
LIIVVILDPGPSLGDSDYDSDPQAGKSQGLRPLPVTVPAWATRI